MSYDDHVDGDGDGDGDDGLDKDDKNRNGLDVCFKDGRARLYEL